MFYDALKIPLSLVKPKPVEKGLGHLPEGVGMLISNADGAREIAEPLLGTERNGWRGRVSNGRYAYVRTADDGYYVSTDPTRGEYHPKTSDKAGQPRYDWTPLDGGIMGGVLRADSRG